MKCSPPRNSDAPLTKAAVKEVMGQIPEWALIVEDGERKLRRAFAFPNFVRALGFANQVGGIAEEEGHHPVITLTWGRASVTWYTHSIDGLHRNDFIMAAKTDQSRAQG
jgi:4a-hydroxytetrahydrobiopterin dehydratase